MAFDFYSLSQELRMAGLDQHPSELHGILTGYLCSGSLPNLSDLSELMSTQLTMELQNLLAGLIEQTTSALQDDALGFELLLAGDDEPIVDRSRMLGYWCSGFLYGFGASGLYQTADLPDDVREIFTDLEKISSFGEEVPDGEDNETDLFEIQEFVKVGVLTIYLECAGPREIH